MNSFVEALGTKDTVTENNALSHSTSKSTLVDYFFNCGNNRGRAFKAVGADMAAIFSQDPLAAMKLVFYNRMITRKPHGLDDMHSGQGQRDEFIKSIAWLEYNKPELLFNNLDLIPKIGCWKDLWYDSAVTGVYHYVNQDKVYQLILESLSSDHDLALLAKYLPRIRSRSNTHSDRHKRINNWARGLCNFLGWSEKDYRTFKSGEHANAHRFQQQMCNSDWDNIDFNTIPGKALFKMVSGKGKVDGKNVFERHSLKDKYIDWIKSNINAKFTGYVYELYQAARTNRNLMQKYTYDAQFNTLLQNGRDSGGIQGNVWCALDTSGSMSCLAAPGIACIDICISLGIYFSALNEGAFKDNVVMFDNTSKIKRLTGEFTDRVDQIHDGGWAMGSTNFQSVIDLIVDIRKRNPEIPISDYPETLIVVSDMQFNPTATRTTWGYTDNVPATQDVETNYEMLMRKLKEVGLPKINVVWWNCNSRYGSDFPSQITDGGTTLISGFDPTILSMILGGEQHKIVDGEKVELSPEDRMAKALDQQLLSLVKV